MIQVSQNGIFKSESCNVIIITGHYGSGKTEFAVNLALAIAQQQASPTALVDIDIVNPYFRSRECRALLEKNNIRLITSSQAHSDADVPALPPDILTVFADPALTSVIDVGGDAAGARVLSRFKPQLEVTPHEMLFVLNANRPLTANSKAAIDYIRRIEEATRTRITGIVNNTHLCGDTTPDEIEKGALLCRVVSEATELPFVCSVCEKKLLPLVKSTGEELFPVDILMKKPWE